MSLNEGRIERVSHFERNQWKHKSRGALQKPACWQQAKMSHCNLGPLEHKSNTDSDLIFASPEEL